MPLNLRNYRSGHVGMLVFLIMICGCAVAYGQSPPPGTLPEPETQLPLDADAPHKNDLQTTHTEAADTEADTDNEPQASLEPLEFQDPAKNKLAFSFNGAPWREVLNWLAAETGLALHVSQLPSGSFTYSDPEQFSAEEAISRLNLFLIPQGYSVVRRGQLLSVITLGDPRSMQQLDAMAELVTRDDIASRSSNTIVKCMIPLGELEPQVAIAELQPLMLMSTPVTLPQSNQLIVVDTAEKLRSVLAVIDAMQPAPADEIIVRRLRLKHTDFETVVAIAGSHLGIQDGPAMSSDFSMSTDVTGTSMFVSGTKAQVEKLESLLTVIDVADEQPQSASQLILKSHPVTAGSLQSVYDVLITILRDKEIRLSMEAKTSSIVALADADVHRQIEQTIEELKAPAVEFAVVSLQTLDPYFAISLLGQMFGNGQQEFDRDARSRSESGTSPTIEPPRIDADPENRRLFVRGTRQQILEVQQIINSLDGVRPSGDAVRVVPLRGIEGKRSLDFAREAWRGRNDVIVIPPAKNATTEVIERALNPTSPKNVRVADSKKATLHSSSDAGDDMPDDSVPLSVLTVSSDYEQYVSAAGNDADRQVDGEDSAEPGSLPAVIRSQLTPQGIVIQSDDVAALNEFEELLSQLGSVGKGQISPPIAYYLKYVNADEAVKMLADLLDGENALAKSPSGMLVNGGKISSASEGYLGSLLYSREGRTTVSAGSATIVSDARLNRLIVQGTTEDIALVEKYLKLIDKGESITNIETFGRSHVIELVHTKAEDVAKMIREAFRGRIVGEDSGEQRSQRDPRDPRRDAERRDDDGSDQRAPVDKPTRGRQAEMTVAVHEPSNSLVITAPDPLFKEVERLIDTVDTNSEQVVQVITASDGVDMEAIMQRIMGMEPSNGRRSNSNSSQSRSRDSSSDRNRSSRR